MGLGVGVGVLAEVDDEEEAAEYRVEFDALSAALAAEGVSWREPEGVTVPPMRENFGGFPYSWLHFLRRVLALVDDGQPVTPVAGPELSAEDDAQINELAIMFESHLVCHSDCDGYYIPVDFKCPLFLPEEAGVAGGGMVGSSQGLLTELRRCAPAIGIRLDDDGSLSDVEAARLCKLSDGADYAVESIVWLTLHEACRVSIASGCAIVYR